MEAASFSKEHPSTLAYRRIAIFFHQFLSSLTNLKGFTAINCNALEIAFSPTAFCSIVLSVTTPVLVAGQDEALI